VRARPCGGLGPLPRSPFVSSDRHYPVRVFVARNRSREIHRGARVCRRGLGPIAQGFLRGPRRSRGSQCTYISMSLPLANARALERLDGALRWRMKCHWPDSRPSEQTPSAVSGGHDRADGRIFIEDGHPPPLSAPHGDRGLVDAFHPRNCTLGALNRLYTPPRGATPHAASRTRRSPPQPPPSDRRRYRGKGGDMTIAESMKKNANDTGSPEYQIARLSARVTQLTGHLQVTHATDPTPGGGRAPPPRPRGRPLPPAPPVGPCAPPPPSPPPPRRSTRRTTPPAAGSRRSSPRGSPS